MDRGGGLRDFHPGIGKPFPSLEHRAIRGNEHYGCRDDAGCLGIAAGGFQVEARPGEFGPGRRGGHRRGRSGGFGGRRRRRVARARGDVEERVLRGIFGGFLGLCGLGRLGNVEEGRLILRRVLLRGRHGDHATGCARQCRYACPPGVM